MQALEESFARADAILRDACGKEFTGAVARIEYQGRVCFERAYGLTRDNVQAVPVAVDTLFDLASITKPFTTTLALRAVEQGKLALDRELVGFFPEWHNRPHAAITLRMLLAHNSGMNSGADYRELLDHNVVQFALERDLAANPGERVIYSDLGFIAIGELLQRLEGRSLNALTRSMRASPRFMPPASLRANIPATENDGWRGRVQGFVHDEKAYLMGGVAGHAGLFGTAADVAWLAEQYLFAARDGRDGLAKEAITEQAPDPILRRGLGWALKTTDENSCGRWFSMESFGHTGFVGTCVWADPVRDCSGVLLTNAVYFGRNDIRDLRAAFYEAMIEELGLQ
ncbi:MAG TPA: serine hydrolase [Candidatus Rubrimentiphilum sp.]|nr:serine hydrolase [Candidatus Rubrimentiphilum sp.]